MPASTPSDTAAPTTRGPLLVVFLTVFIDLLGFGIVLPVLPRQVTPYLDAIGLSPLGGGAGGAVIGLLSALMGIGGGAITNLLLTLHGVDIRRAISTAAGVGVLIALPGTLGYVAAGWGKPLPKGRALGFAYVESYGALCAQVVEASLEDGEVKVHRVVCVLDCARVVTPDGARNQVEGGIVQGLSSGLYEGIEIADGACQNRNFDGYRLMRMNEAPPVIETIFVENDEVIGGVGEPPVPPATPALVNALFALTGKPIRKLPIVQNLG